MATLEQGEIVLSTGKRIRAIGDVIGIADERELYSGYDDQITIVDWLERRLILSPAERKELADYAISLWQKFAALTDDELLKP